MKKIWVMMLATLMVSSTMMAGNVKKSTTLPIEGEIVKASHPMIQYVGRVSFAKNPDVAVNDPQKVIDAVSEVVFMSYENRFNKDLEDSVKLDYERRVLLGIIDHTWINHIDAMQKLRNGIYLRAYAQRDPLQEYTEEGFYMFEEMTKSISQEIARNIVHMGIRPGTEAEMNIPEIKVELEFK